MNRILTWVLIGLLVVTVLVLYHAYAPIHRFNVPPDVERQIEKAKRR
ncbi:MAG: hypothetical protein JO307_06795 [Bryobacterales bacterium]|nr:hypothetical protein [Bryobacterales bacterium]MBV9399584.1 hypothetical protein [Bryobacterales bacterium]